VTGGEVAAEVVRKDQDNLPRIIPKAPGFRLGMKAISNLKIKKSPVL